MRLAWARPQEPRVADTDSWTFLKSLIEASPHKLDVAPPDAHAHEDLAALRITDNSLMGALILNTGGVVVDGGWLRILGSNSDRLGRSLRGWNDAIGLTGKGLLLVADDALGGYFVLNGGALPGEPGGAYYFAPDTLEYEPLNCGHTALVQFLLGPALADFYKDQRWAGWQEMVATLDGDRCVFIHPPLWSAGPPIEERHKGTVPLAEIIILNGKALQEMRPGHGLLLPHPLQAAETPHLPKEAF